MAAETDRSAVRHRILITEVMRQKHFRALSEPIKATNDAAALIGFEQIPGAWRRKNTPREMTSQTGSNQWLVDSRLKGLETVRSDTE
jgi:hypothetical protein